MPDTTIHANMAFQKGVTENRTSIMIAHRLSTIIDADKILVLRNGQIEEQGKHSELLVEGGLYHSLWQNQTDTEFMDAQ